MNRKNRDLFVGACIKVVFIVFHEKFTNNTTRKYQINNVVRHIITAVKPEAERGVFITTLSPKYFFFPPRTAISS